ncbi:pyrimidine 2, partial [Prunus dulcis]
GQCARSTSRRRPGHHRPSRSPPWVPTGPPPCRCHNLTNLHPGAALSWPEIVFSDGGSFEATRTSSSKFSFVSPPNRSSKRFIDLLFMDNQASEVVEVHRIHHRATLSLRASKSGENFGIGQNTGETLPNFQQKSKGILKIN